MSGPQYLGRRYRERMGARFRSLTASYKESDLWIGVDPGSYSGRMEDFASSRVRKHRLDLEYYIAQRPDFLASLVPMAPDPEAPSIARAMLAASAAAGVGPMAAVAGAVAAFVCAEMEAEFGCREIAVENGGDIRLRFEEEIELSVFAGSSPLSERVGVSIPRSFSPLGVCTSSGTVGPSLSLGRADAAMVICRDAAGCRDAALADAWATAIGNVVTGYDDIDDALGLAEGRDGIVSVLIIKDDRMGIRGELPLKLFDRGY
jgi:ApbE superfamily uncharacterized protein (UPF0280 family)